MKKIWIYLLGLISGIVLTGIVIFLLATIYNVKNDPGYQMINGITFFEEPGDIIDENSFEVFQALGDGSALAHGKGDGHSIYTGITVLLYNKEHKPYYDEQIIEVPNGKCARQVGLYRYTSKMDIEKTVPVVEIMDK